ncbi:hypothetical protein HYFRA_00012303 [Hymenoscyphus fraxineus]|uniref:Uncharacterized protein n=1 Tax=Hymenoscyphus fraxineus TaxID=746836 RepID=A0A9N9L289_9HELO|nr:hypothetical protein HYFRA_00012303 [Hymenoscyphus fraxineus]
MLVSSPGPLSGEKNGHLDEQCSVKNGDGDHAWCFEERGGVPEGTSKNLEGQSFEDGRVFARTGMSLTKIVFCGTWPGLGRAASIQGSGLKAQAQGSRLRAPGSSTSEQIDADTNSPKDPQNAWPRQFARCPSVWAEMVDVIGV